MTITNEPTTTAEVPAWIDLDQIVSPELRAESLAMVDEIKAYMVESRGRAARYQELVDRVRESFDSADVGRVDPDLNGLYDTLRQLTGLEHLEIMGWLIGAMFNPTPDTAVTEDWLADQAIRLGLGGLLASAVSGNVDGYKAA